MEERSFFRIFEAVALNLFHLLLISLGLNLFFYLWAAILRTDAFTDITYASTIAALTIIQFVNTGTGGFYSFVLLICLVLWALRLGAYLLLRIRRIKIDHRFDTMRDSPLRFGVFWLIQALTVWIILLPSFAIFQIQSAGTGLEPNFIQILAIALFVIGFLSELIADIQKYRFKKNNPDRFINQGLWKYSRHPNYFGELLIWWGLSLPGVTIFSGFQFLYFIGPLLLTILLLFGTGIPPIERAWKKKWGHDPYFQSYMKRTSLIIPWPPKKS